MSIAGGISLAIGLSALGLVVAALVGVVGASASGYVCFGFMGALFAFAGVALLSASRVVPDRWPPRDDDG
jgi:hypothetical protein